MRKMGKENRIFVDGKTLNQIAEESGIKLDTIQHRYSRGIRTYEGLTKPSKRMLRGAEMRKPMYIMDSGDRMMEVIIKSGISMAELARRTGLSTSTIYAFVYEHVDISSARLAKLCGALGCSSDYILGL